MATTTELEVPIPFKKFMEDSDISHDVNSYGVEYFHIYTDETIAPRHLNGLAYLRECEKEWAFDYTRIVLVDNYNPTRHITSVDDVLKCLSSEGMAPDYWAYEGSMVVNAQRLLDSLTDRKLRKNYSRYIEQHKKFPCSLLTASWYLTRLGYFESSDIIHSVSSRDAYVPVNRIVNFLPEDYRQVEERALRLIRKSKFTDAAECIEDVFYPIDAGREVNLL